MLFRLFLLTFALDFQATSVASLFLSFLHAELGLTEPGTDVQDGFLGGRFMSEASGVDTLARGLIVNRSGCVTAESVHQLLSFSSLLKGRSGVMVLVGSLGQLRSLGNSRTIAPFTGTHSSSLD